MNKIEKTAEILRFLNEEYPDAKCELTYRTPFELIVATILSAQTTDVSVNNVTKDLFLTYNTPEDFLSLGTEELENKIRRIGLYRNKAKNIIMMCQQLIEKFGGEVPQSFEELLTLAGVGRKTANVVLSNAFNIPALAVDTHVFRVSNRLGMANSEDVFEVEIQLKSVIDKEQWSKAHHLLIFHGRRCCKAKRPECERCVVNYLCNSFNSSAK